MSTKALQHVTTGRVYPIKDVIEENGVTKVVIQGEHGDFAEDLDIDRFHEMGYKRVTLDDDGQPIAGKKV